MANRTEMSLESVLLIAENMIRAAEFAKNKVANDFPNNVICHVILDDEFIIGEIQFSDEFEDNVVFFPNGDWFGDEIVRMG
jgi:hypothetical protein